MTTDNQPTEQGVLASLDTKAPTSFYWYLALLATTGGFLFGYAKGLQTGGTSEYYFVTAIPIF